MNSILLEKLNNARFCFKNGTNTNESRYRPGVLCPATVSNGRSKERSTGEYDHSRYF